MAKAWTTQQRAAMDTRAANILVSAAAGSGKTAVLVERIIKQIILLWIHQIILIQYLQQR